MAEISYHDVGKRYLLQREEIHAVKDFNLTIADRELVVLVGPSGCGKTTTLRMTAGLENLDHGTIRIDGAVVNDVSPVDRDVAMVFQNYALYPHLTAFDNMAFGLKMRKVATRDRRARVLEISQMLGIEHLLQRKPKTLSGGERQRVAIGRAIVRQPKLLLLDEPLSNLDARLRAQTRSEIKALHQRLDTTMLYVTHDQLEAMTMGDRVVVMRDGVIQQVGEPLEVYESPTNRFVAGFIGSPAMNVFDAEIVSRDGEVLATTEFGSFPVPKSGGQIPEEVVVGFRPEALEVANGSGSETDVSFTGRIEFVEPVGDRVHLHLSVSGEHSATAVVSARSRWSAGTKVSLRVSTDQLHFFDASEPNGRIQPTNRLS